MNLYGFNGQPLRKITNKPDDRLRHVTKGLQEWFVGFADFLKRERCGLHCGLCHTRIKEPAKAYRHWGECPGHKSFDALQPAPRIPESVELTDKQMEWFRQGFDVCKHFEFGMHCERFTCDADIHGANADTDPFYVVSCNCRRWVGPNRDYVEPNSAEAFYQSVKH